MVEPFNAAAAEAWRNVLPFTRCVGNTAHTRLEEKRNAIVLLTGTEEALHDCNHAEEVHKNSGTRNR